jgi:hypothetical protein
MAEAGGESDIGVKGDIIFDTITEIKEDKSEPINKFRNDGERNNFIDINIDKEAVKAGEAFNIIFIRIFDKDISIIKEFDRRERGREESMKGRF